MICFRLMDSCGRLRYFSRKWTEFLPHPKPRPALLPCFHCQGVCESDHITHAIQAYSSLFPGSPEQKWGGTRTFAGNSWILRGLDLIEADFCLNVFITCVLLQPVDRKCTCVRLMSNNPPIMGEATNRFCKPLIPVCGWGTTVQ